MATHVFLILELLDKGLSIYRRNFGRFVLIAAAWFIPMIIGTSLLIYLSDQLDSLGQILLTIAIVVLALPISMYLIGGLLRAADDAIHQRPINLGQTITIHPLRSLGMSVFTIVYGLIVQIISGMILFLCFCPLIFVSGILLSFIGAASGSSVPEPVTIMLSVIAGVLLFGGGYLTIILSSGMSIFSMIYALHPWATTQLRFGRAFQHSFDLVTYRFGFNLLLWVVATLVLTSAGISIAIMFGILIPLPIYWLLDPGSDIAEAVAATAWLLGLVLVLPSIPIWMALLYQYNHTKREGADLADRIAAWHTPPEHNPL
jgi:hypothetical protein